MIKLCSPLQRAALVHSMGALLTNSAAMLGHQCTAECLAVLLSSLLDSIPCVRAAAQQAWCAVRYALKQGEYTSQDAYMKVVDTLSAKYLDTVRAVQATAAVGNEGKLKDQLSSLLGIGSGLQQHLVQLVRSSGVQVVQSVTSLLAPDVGSMRTSVVLESRCYRYYSWSSVNNKDGEAKTTSSVIESGLSANNNGVSVSGSVEGGYYRGAWRLLQDRGCKELTERLALFLGRYGE